MMSQIHNKQVKPPRDRDLALAFMGMTVFSLLILVVIAATMIFVFENRINSGLNMSDGFRAIETSLGVEAETPIYPLTVSGRVTFWVSFFLALLIIALFVVQVVDFCKSSIKRARGGKSKVDRRLARVQRASLKIEHEILDKQKELLEVEDNIIKKLDRLRDLDKK
jgi:hypothetical protein